MKNYVQDGNVLTLTAPYDVASGAAFKVGSILAVATSAALSTASVEAAVAGVYDLAKASAEAWTVGAKVYWDDAAKVCTTTSSGNTLIGVAVAVAANPSSTGRVRLNAAFS
jgi:predicted RecA/RadA family phage recombinase